MSRILDNANHAADARISAGFIIKFNYARNTI